MNEAVPDAVATVARNLASNPDDTGAHGYATIYQGPTPTETSRCGLDPRTHHGGPGPLD